MMAFLGALLSNITFMQPALLAAILALPVLWYILRITPPAPKKVFFPATAFLMGLNSGEKTPSKAPWWILLLRLIMAALIILALARPVTNQAQSISGDGAVRLVIDNGWAGAQLWDMQIKAAEETITQAGRENRDIYILPTTNANGDVLLQQIGPLPSGEALSILRGLQPYPWPADYEGLANFIEKSDVNDPDIQTIWLSHGLDGGGAKRLMLALQHQGSLTYIAPPLENLPLILRSSHQRPKKGDPVSGVKIAVDAPSSIPSNIPVTVQVSAAGNNILDARAEKISSDDLPKTLYFEISEDVKNSVTRFDIAGRKGAGASFIVDDQHKKRDIGIAAATIDENATPLIEASYYLKRAFEPFGNVVIEPVQVLIDVNPSVIVLPDVSAMPSETLNHLEKWVKDGGLLLRFAGPNMASSVHAQFLLPVPLRSGGRALSGSLSWDKPQVIAPFTQDSPFYGLDIPSDVTIKQQVLADPAQNIDSKTWAQLEDGTPFITASRLDKGLIVLIHSTANTDWSDFALSGLYVDVLKRIVQMAGSNTSYVADQNFTALDPLLVMDGFGAMIAPSPTVKPLPAGKYEDIVPSASYPPGLYGRGSIQYALNLGDHLPKLMAMTDLPTGVLKGGYEKDYEVDLMPFLLYAALFLFCIDWVIMIFVAGNMTKNLRGKAFVAALIIMSFIPHSSFADEQRDIKYAGGFYLAYIETGDSALDTITNNGLETLADVLTRRTSIEPAGVAGLNPETDTLSFFPIIYWAIGVNQKIYSAKAIEHIQRYLDQGGTILFDTRDQNQSKTSFSNTENAKKLRQITASLNIPPIAPIPDDHVLGRSFYLLDEYPGRYTSGTLWVEKNSVSGRDNVSSVLIGGNDWAGSWADSTPASTRYGGSYDARQKEMSLRFGVNLVMYAMTGNYKADQVHIPHILERLDR
ncbi:MAG: DUF4159 domain-containing protein [Alphaproteobacteria bacterium]